MAPAAPWATLRFALPAATPVSLAVYTSDGRCARVLLEQELPAGEHVLGWDGADERGAAAPPGRYTLRLEAAGSTLACRSVWLT